MARNEGIIYKVCRLYLCSDRSYIPDLFQDIVVGLWESYPQYKSQSSESTWVYGVASHIAVDYLRRRQRRPTLLTNLPSLPELHLPAESSERLDALYEAIAQLQQPDRDIIMLWLENYSYQDIADYLSITPSLVGTRLLRAKEKLKQIGSSAIIGWYFRYV